MAKSDDSLYTTAEPSHVDPADLAWRQAMREAIRDPVELCRRLQLPRQYELPAVRAARLFPLFAPPPYVARMRRGDPFDPLLRQVLPLAAELHAPEGYESDPVADQQATLQPGLIKKYPGRALLIVTGTCAVHCRYCFRRHYPYDSAPRSDRQWQPALDTLAHDPSIEEVILSGGDPLTLSDRRLAFLVSRLEAMPHVRRLRVHTRLPVMIPQRVTGSLIRWLRGTRLVPIVVVHINHPAEIDNSVHTVLGRLVDAGVPVLNQSVLLRGVNDRMDTLKELSLRLIDARVIPYYLHQLDRVAGAAHFEVPLGVGRRLLNALRQTLPGYAVPRYVREVPGASHKLPLG